MATKILTVTALHKCKHQATIEVFCSDDALGTWARRVTSIMCFSCEDSWKTAWVSTGSRDAMKIIEAEWENATGPLTPARRQELTAAFPMVLPPLGQGQYRML